MNLRKLRRVFAKISESVTTEGRKGVLALANVGDTQSHGQELVAEKLAQVPKESRPTSAVFWHRQSHARAFDAEGELQAKLVLHWIGARTRIAAALTEAFANEPEVKLTLAAHDELAFAIAPVASARAAAVTEKKAETKPKKAAKVPAVSSSPRASAPAFDVSKLQVSKLKDTPETHAMLVRAVREGEGRAALAALVVLMRFALKRDEKEDAKRRKAGTETAYYAELAQRPGLFAPEVVDALVANAEAVCEALEEKDELSLRLALRQAQKAAHPGLRGLFDTVKAASPWRTRRLLAELGSHPGATRELLHARLSALAADENINVVSEVCRSLGAFEGTSEAAIMIRLLEGELVVSAVRDWLFWSLAHSTLSSAERAKARPLADLPVFAKNEHRERFLETTAG